MYYLKKRIQGFKDSSGSLGNLILKIKNPLKDKGGQVEKDRGQRSEDRGQRSEVRGQRTEDRGQKKEGSTTLSFPQVFRGNPEGVMVPR